MFYWNGAHMKFLWSWLKEVSKKWKEICNKTWDGMKEESKTCKTWSVKGFNGEVSSREELSKKWNEKCNKTWSWLKFLIRAEGRVGAGATDGMVGVSLENWGSGRKIKLLRKVKILRKNETFEGKENVENSTTKKNMSTYSWALSSSLANNVH